MKIQYLAVIFILIIMPIVIVFSEYINNQITTIRTENIYDAKLLDSTYDAIKAYQLNTINNVYSEKAQFKKTDIEAAATTFLNSISTSFEYTGYKSDVIKEYVPAIVYTMYDGYYIYSPFVNTLTGVSAEVDEEYENEKTLHGLKPFVYYTCRYKRGSDDFTIGYTLDNYISIEGYIKGEHRYIKGYLHDLNKFNIGEDSITFDGVEMKYNEDFESMWEYIGDKKFYYMRIDGDKFYYSGPIKEKDGKTYYEGGECDGEPKEGEFIFSINNNGGISKQYINSSKNLESKAKFEIYYNNIFKNKKGMTYYYKSYSFTKFVLDDLNLKNLTVGDAVDQDGNKIGSDEFDSDLNLKIFEGTIEESDSNFNRHRADVIKRSIKTNLSTAISGYSRYSNLDTNVDFIMPKISDTDWNLITNNVCIATFLQGMPIGGKIYNSYSVVPNNLNKEYVDEDDIYVLKYDDTYAKANETREGLTLNKERYGIRVKDKGTLGYYPGILKINFEKKRDITGASSSGYYYPVGLNSTTPYYGSYKSIVGSSSLNSVEYIDMYKYMKNLEKDPTNAELKKAYYIALGRERESAYNVNNGMSDIENVKIAVPGLEYLVNLENGWYFSSDISLADVELNPTKYDFDYENPTKKYRPDVKVKDKGILLTSGKDYTYEYKDNDKVGKGKVIITGKGMYTGQKVVTFDINASDVESDYEIILSQDTYVYTGSAHKPKVTLKFKGETLDDSNYDVLYSENINAGKAVAQVMGKGNYSYIGTKDFRIEPKSLNSADISVVLDNDNYVFDGSSKRPIPTVTDLGKPDTPINNRILVEDVDYTLEYNVNSNAGIGVVRIIGKDGGNYKDIKEITFSIEGLDASGELTVILSQTTFIYDGTPKKPGVAVVYKGTRLVEGTDYTVTYENNINPGIATVTVTGRGNYAGTTKSENFVITSKDAQGLDVKLTPDTFIYDGTPKTPSVEVRDEGNIVSPDYYDVAYVENTNVGQGKVIVTGKGLYNNKNVIAIFSIYSKPIQESGVTLNPNSMQYTGSKLNPGVIVKDGNKTLVRGTDYTVSYGEEGDNINVDKGTVIVRGIGNYSGRVEKTFTITPKPIQGSWVTLSKTTYAYQGAEVRPEVRVRDSDRNVVLTLDEDYTVDYNDNINIGTAKVIVKGKGNYTGTINKTFTISNTTLANAVLEITPREFTYDTTRKMPEYVVKLNGNVLRQDVDYTVNITNDLINVGTKTISITGKGNCTGTLSDTFKIKPKNITDSDVTISLNPSNLTYTFNWDDKIPTVGIKAKFHIYTYTSDENLPSVPGDLNTVPTGEVIGREVIKDIEVNLQNNTDYTLTYSNNRNVGTGNLTIEGRGNYTGKIERNIIIGAKNISSTTITLNQSTYTYDGNAKTPTPTVKDGNHTLVKDTDYTVSYSNNTAAGTATVTVTGKGNFTGTKSVNFTIEVAAVTRSGNGVIGYVGLKEDGGAIRYADIKVTYELTYGSGSLSGSASIDAVRHEYSQMYGAPESTSYVKMAGTTVYTIYAYNETDRTDIDTYTKDSTHLTTLTSFSGVTVPSNKKLIISLTPGAYYAASSDNIEVDFN